MMRVMWRYLCGFPDETAQTAHEWLVEFRRNLTIQEQLCVSHAILSRGKLFKCRGGRISRVIGKRAVIGHL